MTTETTPILDPISVPPSAPPLAPPPPTAENHPFPYPPTNLPFEDGIPLESDWHRLCMNLLLEAINSLNLGRSDFFAGGNMFIYFSSEQVRNQDFRGPDVFYVKNVPHREDRLYWAIWDEGGRYPNVIIELTSPTTSRIDHTIKKDVYEERFRTPEYFIYDPYTEKLEGWELVEGKYRAKTPNENGWLWSAELGTWLGKWIGPFQGRPDRLWIRLYDRDGQVVPLFAERAEMRADEEKLRADEEKLRADEEKLRADEEKLRAEKAEQEIARLKALLAEKGIELPSEPA